VTTVSVHASGIPPHQTGRERTSRPMTQRV
jgi:hypothetical protein